MMGLNLSFFFEKEEKQNTQGNTFHLDPVVQGIVSLTLLHSEQPDFHRVLAVLSAIGSTIIIQGFVNPSSTHKNKCANVFAKNVEEFTAKSSHIFGAKKWHLLAKKFESEHLVNSVLLVLNNWVLDTA